MDGRANVEIRVNPRIQLYGFEKRLIVEAMEAVERVRLRLVAHELDSVVDVTLLDAFVERLDEDLFSAPGDVFDLTLHDSGGP
jgi:hypothetical protein